MANSRSGDSYADLFDKWEVAKGRAQAAAAQARMTERRFQEAETLYQASV